MKYYIKKPYYLCKWKNTTCRLYNQLTHTAQRLAPAQRDLLIEIAQNGGKKIDPSKQSLLNKLLDDQIITTNKDESSKNQIKIYPCIRKKIVQLSLTGRCNLRCKHCLAAADTHATNAELSFSEIIKILDEMQECGIYQLMLTGGEPLVRKDFIDIVKAAVERNIKVTRIYTNGILIDNDLLNSLKAINVNPEFYISFDGLGTHNWMRNYDKAEAETIAAMDRVVSAGFRYSATINVNALSAPRLIETARYLIQEHGCSAFHIILTGPSPRWMETTGLKKDITLEQYFDLGIELIKTSRKENWNVHLDIIHMPTLHNIVRGVKNLEDLKTKPDVKPFCDLPQSFFDKKYKVFMNTLSSYKCPCAVSSDLRLSEGCSKLTNMVFIACDGRVLPCSGFEGETSHQSRLVSADSNVKNRSIVDILTESEYTEQIKGTVEDLINEDEMCRDCKWVGLCRGGCSWFRFVSKYRNTTRPTCVFFKGGFVDKYLAAIEMK